MAVRNKTLLVFIGFNTVFLLCAALHLLIPLFTRSQLRKPATLDNVASNLLLDECPLTASMVNSGIMFLSFLISFPAMTFLRRNLFLLQAHACLVTLCATFTLGIGLEIWFSTLQTKRNLSPVFNKQSTTITSMLQLKFNCCGYDDSSTFVLDGTCPNSASAVRHGTCEGPFSVFANQFLDIVFTTFFGFVAVDFLVLLSTLCVIKQRKEVARYRAIDEKSKYGGI